ncbi:ABC transporter substrate-binding protein [Streptomyces sp. NPDC056373]|uniref:ABC transporter substrate-binding protein n=1 Tax=Streptomyces sp. NPDC056373 TaxID=3345798 RepID=UPI0035E1675B
MTPTRRPAVPLQPSRRRVLASLGALGLGTAVAGCGTDATSADGEVGLDFQWWGGDERSLATRKAIRLFERRHPKIKVSVSFTGYDSYFQRLATQVAAGTGPDVLQMDYYELRDYAANGLIANLSGPGFSGVRLDRVPRRYVDSNRLDGKLWAVPTGVACQALLVDPEIWQKAGGLPKAGWTWDDLVHDVGPALKRAAPGRAPLTDFGGYSETFDLWLVQRGKSLYRHDGSLGFTRADLTAFWEMTARLRDAGIFTPPNETASYDGSTPNSLLVRKLSTAEFNITSTVQPYFDTYGDVRLIPFPTVSSGAPLGLTVGPGMMCVRRGSRHPRQAAQLLDFLLNDPEAGSILGVVRGLPPNRQIMNRIAPGLSSANRTVYEYVVSLEKRLTSSSIPPSGSSEDKLLFRGFNEDVLFGKTTVREAAADMFEKYNTTVPKG